MSHRPASGGGGFMLWPRKVVKTFVFSSFFTFWSSQEGFWSSQVPQGPLGVFFSAFWAPSGTLWEAFGCPFASLWSSFGTPLGLWAPLGSPGVPKRVQKCPGDPQDVWPGVPRRRPGDAHSFVLQISLLCLWLSEMKRASRSFAKTGFGWSP